MKLTSEHLTFWTKSKAPLPAWAKELTSAKKDRHLIDRLINAQVPHHHTWAVRRAAYANTLSLLKVRRDREGSVIPALIEYCESSVPGRAVMCKRWFRRLGHYKKEPT